MTTSAFIAGYLRSPFTYARKGALASIRPDELGASVIRGLLERTGVPGEEIEDVIWGCAYPEGEQGINLGRVVAMLAGLPHSVCGVTVETFRRAHEVELSGRSNVFMNGIRTVRFCTR